jgi:diacylglycerol kinase (ATP)
MKYATLTSHDPQVPLHIIHNPYAGGGAWPLTRVRKLLPQLPVDHFHPIHKKGEGMENVPKDAMMIFAGGDGTIYHGIQWMHQHESIRPFGIIPLGTGNVLAKSLGIPASPKAAVTHLMNAKLRPIDGFLVNQTYLGIIGAGIGAHADIMRTTPTILKKALGASAYYLNALSYVSPIRQHQAKLTIDDNEPVQITGNTIAVVNTTKSFEVAPFNSAFPDDGKLHIFVLRHKKHREFIEDLMQLGMGKRGNLHYVDYFSGSKISIDIPSATTMQIDGEIIDEPLRSLEIRPHAFMILC